MPATEKLCAQQGLSIRDFDVIELNEAFASQALACMRELGLDDNAPHVNANGGGIALGGTLWVCPACGLRVRRPDHWPRGWQASACDYVHWSRAGGIAIALEAV